jgi:L-threonylcarbamoyladenylate synthase
MKRVRLGDLVTSAAEVSRFRELVSRGGVAAVPTETYYALAADPRSRAGVDRVFRIKRRDDGKPLPTLFSERGQLADLGVEAPPETLDRFFAIWPAPLTVVLPLRESIAASRGASSLAVRLPDAPDVRALLSLVGPLTGTSANRSGEAPIARPDDVAPLLGDDLDLLVDGGPTPGGPASTIVDATVDPPRLLRPGAFAWTDETH